MKIQLTLIILGCYFSSCRRRETYPDYKNVVGKYKLEYIQKYNYDWPLDSFVRIFPSDKYEIEFRKWSKVDFIKNGNPEKTLKVNKCEAYNYETVNHYWMPYTVFHMGYKMTIDKTNYDFSNVVNYLTGNPTDTLEVYFFYPFGLVDTLNQDEYSCKFLKE